MILSTKQKVFLFLWVSFFNSLIFASCSSPLCITIYVHGTTTALGLKLLSRFYTDVSFGEQGLHHISKMGEDALLRKDIELLQQQDPIRFCIDHFYTFGWSGKLKDKAREIAGEELYKAVQILLKEYKKKYGFFPTVRLLTFSHGGNVALHMVKHLPYFADQQIDLELVLVAVPVQKTTSKFIEHPCIHKSYVISSTRDLIQLVDYYTYEKKRYFPERFFETTQSNCCQIEVEINNRGLGHIDLMRSFMLHLPAALNLADSQNSNQFYLNGKILNGIGCGDACEKILYSVQDPYFRFYNVFNLAKVVRGVRKPVKKSIKNAR